jgi:hypothetical protein
MSAAMVAQHGAPLIRKGTHCESRPLDALAERLVNELVRNNKR